MKTLIALCIFFPFAASAKADECDHVGRTHKTDMAIVSVSTHPATTTGDITVGPTLSIRVRNTGVTTFQRTTADGSLLSVRPLDIALKGRILRGYVRAPLQPGEEATVNYPVDSSILSLCERTSLTIDPSGSLGQWGCLVRSNDTLGFRAYFGRPQMCVRP